MVTHTCYRNYLLDACSTNFVDLPNHMYNINITVYTHHNINEWNKYCSSLFIQYTSVEKSTLDFVCVFDLKQCKCHNAYHNVIWSVLDIIANVMRYFCEGYTPLFRGIGAPQIDNFFMEGLHPYPQKYKFVIFSKTASKHSRRFDAWQ